MVKCFAGLSLRAVTHNTCYGRVSLMLRVKTLIGVMLHLCTGGDATGDHFNEMAAKLNDSPVLDFGLTGLGSSPCQSHCVVFLGKALHSHSASLHPGV